MINTFVHFLASALHARVRYECLSFREMTICHKMLLFRCRTEIPKLDLDSARVPVSQLFKKTALVKIKAAESLRRFVNLTSFKSV